MRRLTRVVAFVAAGLSLGCTAPLEVVQLDSLDAPARGVRYVLKRPIFGVGLRFTQVSDSKCQFDVVVIQKMEGRRFYEARRPSYYKLPLHAFSDSKLSLVLDDEGALTTGTVKEVDRTLEFVKAVAKLATGAVGLREAATPAGCGLPTETGKGFVGYMAARDALRQELAQLQASRAKLVEELSTLEAGRQRSALLSLAALDERTKEVSKRLEELHLPMHSKEYTLRLGDAVVAGRHQGTAWLEVSLEPLRTAVDCGFWDDLRGVCERNKEDRT